MLNPDKVRESYGNRRKENRGISLVAFLGDRTSGGFQKVTHVYDQCIKAQLKPWIDQGWLVPVPNKQGHGTVIGLEAEVYERDGAKVAVNRNLERRLKGAVRSEDTPPMDLSEVGRLCGHMPLPMTVRFFGYKEGDCNPYAASRRERQPYSRTFSVRDNGLLVGIGWSVQGDKGETFVPALLGQRQAFERANVVHKYHECALACDNDFFVVLAETNPVAFGPGNEEDCRAFLRDLEKAQDQIRKELSNKEPCLVTMAEKNCVIVKYGDTGLKGVLDTLQLPGVEPGSLQDLFFGP